MNRVLTVRTMQWSPPHCIVSFIDREEVLYCKYGSSRKREEAMTDDNEFIDTEDDTLPPAPTGDRRLDIVYNCIRVGMAPYQALLIAQYTDDEIASLDNDPAFLARVRFEQTMKEKTLLDSLDKVRLMNERNGSSTETRWLLERINKPRWGRVMQEQAMVEELPAMNVTKQGGA